MNITREQAVEAAAILSRYVGVDTDKLGLERTPERMVHALEEMTGGRGVDVAEILGVVFEEKYDAMIVLDDIHFVSLCEHHLLPFRGVARVGYIPSGRVVGLSKLARLVDAFARRPQIQERLTQEVARALNDHLDCLGVGVIVRSEHMCMTARGVAKSGATMTTSCLLGAMLDGPVRQEFLGL